jgi:flagellar hook-basal body complex protein FliE
MAFINKVSNNANIPNQISQAKKNDGPSFEELLKKEINETNELLENADKLQAEIAAGTVKDLARANIAIQKAEMKMKMMLEVRNKAINAYKELLKTQI